MKFKLLLLCSFIFLLLPQLSQGQNVGLPTTRVGDSDVYNRARQENDRMMDPALHSVPVERIIPANAYRNLVLKPAAKANKSGSNASQTAPISSIPWSERGPTNVGGRTRGLIFDLNDQANGYKKVFAGGVGGGLWVSTDITASPVRWAKINDFFDNIAISFIAQDPKNPQIIYASTGESFGVYTKGLGIWKSTDGGQTWANLSSSRKFSYIASLVVDNNGSIYMAGHYYGIQKSSDGGQTWKQVIGSGYTTDGADLELAANGDLYASTGDFSTGQVYFSGQAANGTSQGNADKWTIITPNTLGVVTSSDNDWLRIKLACAPGDANTVYGLFEGTNSSTNISSIQRYNRATNSWTVATVPTETFSNNQGWYALAIAVDPNDANTLLCGSLDAQKSIDGGATWIQVSGWNYPATESSYVHADHHTYVYAPGSSSRMIMGTDGGISYSSTINNTSPALPGFQTKNNGYNVTQFYSVASHPTSVNYFLAGAQDNGTQQFTQAGLNATTAASDGDGGDVFIDQLTPAVQISSYIYNQHFLSTDNGQSFKEVFFNGDGSFINPSDYDSRGKAMYSGNTAGSYFLWNNVPAGNLTDGVSVPVPGFQNAQITSVTVAPRTKNRIYFGLNNGTICVVDSANTKLKITSIVLTPTTGAANTSISCIAIDPSTENHLLVSYFNYGVTSLFETKNALAPTPVWTSVEGNLPDMPVRWAMFYPGDSTQAFLATELGVWSTTFLNGTSTIWTPTNTGLANTRVDMLKYRAADQTLAAATFGRGLFTATLPLIGKINQTITFTKPAPQTYGGPDLSPGATSTNNTTPITYTSSNAAVGTITAGGKFHILTAGTTTLTASQAGSANYNAATPVSQTLTVQPAPLTITATSSTKLYLDSLPVFSQTYTGFKNGDTTSNLTAIKLPTTTAKSSSPVGTYIITAGSATNLNYTFTRLNGMLTVNKAAQSLTFSAPANQTYGSPDLSPGATSTNTTTPITYTSSNTAVATLSASGKFRMLTAGTTTLTASQAGSANYNAANPVSQTLTVQPAPLTITATSLSKFYLDSVPELYQSYTGFKNGDTTSSLSGITPPTTLARSSSPVGMYTIVAGSATDPNYTFTRLNGTLTVNKASQSLAFSAPAPQTYGGPDLSPGATSTNTTTPITYTSSNTAVATLSASGKFRILTAGTTTLTASQAGSANYNAANPVSQTLTVQPTPLTITAASYSTFYLDSLPVFSQSYTGFKNGDTTSSLTAITLPGTLAKSSSPVGIYAIVAGSATDPNYTFTRLNGTLTINKMPAPTISSINAATLVTGATELITGTNLRNTTSVSFGGTAASSFKIISSTTISAVIGAGSSGTISLTTPGGTATFNSISFIPVPVITTPGLPDIQSGGSLVLSASPASGFAYQWFNNGTAIGGATSSSYTVSQNGSYTASISLNGLSQTSSAMAVTMKFSLPATNFSIVNTSATCIGSGNGSIQISALQHQGYLAVVTGAAFSGAATFTSSTTFSSLPAGAYQVCLTVPSQPGYQQCFTAIVAQPQDLSVYTALDRTSKILSVSLGGASTYFITLNGMQSVTSRNHVDLALSRGTNSLTVSTDKFCQGIISRKILVSEDEQVFPNPFSSVLNLNLGTTLLPVAEIHIYSMNGNLVYTTQYLDQAGVVQLNLSALNSGIYLLKLNTGNDEKTFKIFKK